MPATVTLATTTLRAPVGGSENVITVASTSGLIPGIRLWVDTELMTVMGLGVNSQVQVQRGVDGSSSSPHASSALITIGRADQFYSVAPVGRPPDVIPVSPYIDVIAGNVYFAQGDASPAGLTNRWWQRVTTTYGVGALGVRTSTFDPTSSS